MIHYRIYSCILIICILLGCSQSTPSQSAQKQEAEQFIGVALPQDAQNIQIHVESGMDSIYYIRFDASPESAVNFANSLGLTLREQYNPLSSTTRRDLAWWTPDGLSQYQGAEFTTASGKVFELVIDSSKTVHQVYLRAFDL